jgi:type IV pilus assembly protein PilX
MNNCKYLQHSLAQKGSALIFSLLILLVMTIVGVSSLNSTIMEEKISANHQDATTAFQAAETVNTQAIADALPEDSSLFEDARKKFYDSDADAAVYPAADVATNSELTVEGKGPHPNSSYGIFIGYRMEFTGTGTVTGTHAKAVNLQGGIKGPYPNDQQ